MSQPLHAFWSYARVSEDAGGAELHHAMRSTLADPISLWGELRLFRDNDTREGIEPGADWAGRIIAAIARSTLFFWIQSPRWLRSSSMCAFEFEAFEDRVARIGRQFIRPGSPLTTKALSDALLVPVRLFDMTSADWTRIDPPVRARFEPEWTRRQVLGPLHIAQARLRGPDGANYSRSCMDAAQPIAQSFGAVLDALGTDLATLNAFIASDSVDFEQHWLRTFEARAGQARRAAASAPAGDDDLLTAQQRLAQRLGCAAPPAVLSLSWVLVPDALGQQGFWAAASALPNRMAPVFAEWLSASGQKLRGPGGFMLFSAADAAAIGKRLRGLGLNLPTPDQAVRLQAIFAKGRDHALRLGFQSSANGFWFANASGQLAATGSGQGLRLLLPVAAAQ